jgi:hypothetical protein
MEPAPIDSGQVIRYVSESLRAVIRAHIPEFAAESAVVFDSPADIDSQGESTLSLYLYQLESNPTLRNLPPALTRHAGPPDRPASLQLAAAPLVVDLSYMMVCYAKSAELELVLIDKLVRLFHDIGALTGALLHPLLRQAGNQSIAIVPVFNSLDAVRHIWSGFPHKAFKLTKLYTLSPVRIPSGISTPVDLVTEASVNVGSLP